LKYLSPEKVSELLLSEQQRSSNQMDILNREKLMIDLKEAGIPTMIYYVKPLHLQTAYKHYPTAGALSVCESLADKVLSLPMSGYVDNDELSYIIDQFLTLFANRK
jgi:dTDP-4-amino-4,6-dideoxygalactose transaminase